MIAVSASLWVQLFVNGLTLGAVFALLALGVVMIYKSSGVLSFAHGSIAMFSTYVYFELARSTPLSPWLCAALAVGFGAALSAGTYRLIFARMDGAGLLAKVIASLAVAGALQGTAAFVWKNAAQAKPPLLVSGTVAAGDVSVASQEVLLLCMTVVVAAGLIALVRRSTFGMALRATAQNRAAARMLGVRDRRVAMTSWAIGGGLAALAGVMIVPLSVLTVYSMSGYMVRGFVAAVVGGFVSLPAALAGGLGLGAVQETIKATPAASLSSLVAGVTVAVLLMARVERFFALEQETRALEEAA
jgi:branched-subunit amino acid ABC-type transport system permease component